MLNNNRVDGERFHVDGSEHAGWSAQVGNRGEDVLMQIHDRRGANPRQKRCKSTAEEDAKGRKGPFVQAEKKEGGELTGGRKWDCAVFGSGALLEECGEDSRGMQG